MNAIKAAPERRALEALRAARARTPVEGEALAWGIALLSGPLDVTDLDRRWSDVHYRALLALGEREGFGVARAAGFLQTVFGHDAQQSRGRIRQRRPAG